MKISLKQLKAIIKEELSLGRPVQRLGGNGQDVQTLIDNNDLEGAIKLLYQLTKSGKMFEDEFVNIVFDIRECKQTYVSTDH